MFKSIEGLQTGQSKKDTGYNLHYNQSSLSEYLDAVLP